MDKLYKIFAGVIMLIGICTSPLKAQDEDNTYYKKFIKARRDGFPGRTLSEVHQLRIFFHIVTDDDGSNAGATLNDIPNELADLNADYAPGNICFVYAGLNYIASTAVNHVTINRNDKKDSIFSAHAIPNCLNIFYVKQLLGTNTHTDGPGHGGYTIGHKPVITKGRIGMHSVSHETGHALGLFHTFDTSHYHEEYIDQTSCDSRGDLMCDTRADPFSHYLDKTCFSTDPVTAKYNGTCTDLHGDTAFSPPYDNIMSYWKIVPKRVFTHDQFDEMKYAIEVRNDLVTSASQVNVDITAQQYSSGYVYRSAINSLSTSGEVEFAGSVKAGLYGNSITLKAGFYAHPVNDSVLMKATECNTTGLAGIANTSIASPRDVKSANAMAKSSLDNELVIYPNPSTNYFNIHYSQATFFDAFVTVRNMNGGVVFSTTRKNIFKLQEKIAPGTNARGVYFIEVYINGKRLTAKAVIQ